MSSLRIAVSAIVSLSINLSAANAAIYRLDAARTSDAIGQGDFFYIEYEDVDSDQLFSLDEMLNFSGYYAFGMFHEFFAIPEIEGFTDGGGEVWTFQRGEGGIAKYSINHREFTYQVNEIGAPEVPVPAALPLFLSGMLGFGFLSRRKKRFVV